MKLLKIHLFSWLALIIQFQRCSTIGELGSRKLSAERTRVWLSWKGLQSMSAIIFLPRRKTRRGVTGFRLLIHERVLVIEPGESRRVDINSV